MRRAWSRSRWWDVSRCPLGPVGRAWLAESRNRSLCSMRSRTGASSPSRALLAESRGCVRYVLGAPSAVPIGISQEWQVLCWLQLPGFYPLWSRTYSLASQKLPVKYGFPPRLAINCSKNVKETVVNWVSDTSLLCFHLLYKVFQ